MIVLLKALAKRNTLELRRYPLNTASLLVILYGFFLVVFFGLRAAGGPKFTASEAPSAVTIGFVLWFLVQQSYQELVNQLTNEAAQGTLEQLAMSRPGLLATMGLEFCVGVGTYVVILGVALVPMMATTGRWLHFDAVSLLPLIALTLAGVGGVGLALGGLAMVFKRVTAPAQILQFGFIAMIAAPVSRYPLLKALPLSLGYDLIRRVMVQSESLVTLPRGDLLLLLANTAFYVAGGCLVFKRMDRQARIRGLLGQY